MTKITQNPLLVFDFETSGLSPHQNIITEYAGILLDPSDFSELGRASSIIKPFPHPEGKEWEWSTKAEEITGLSKAVCERDGLPIKEAFQPLLELLKKHNPPRKKALIVGQNIKFDIGFLQMAFSVMKVDMSKYFETWKDYYGNVHPIYLDSLYVARTKYANQPEITKFSLSDICELEGIEIADAHRAMNDIPPVVDFFSKAFGSLRNGSSGEIVEKENFRDTFKFQI